jgi:alpha-methylacyl-CoA racemase
VTDPTGAGPLNGVRVVELAGLASVSFAGMVLADLGADVVQVTRAIATEHGAVPAPPNSRTDVLSRSRRALAVDLKVAEGRDLVLGMIEVADVLIEGFRPGVTERLGLGPEHCEQHNPGLVYGRLTGWGQRGPLAQAAGHDIDYLAVSGALHPIGPAGGRPVPPTNIIGDFAGGGLLLAVGVLAALHERTRSGRGQVVDAAMVDGAALFTTFLHGLLAAGAWTEHRGVNLLDGGAPYYDTYQTADGKHVAVGAIEPHFYAELLTRLGVDLDPAAQQDRTTWGATRGVLATRFRCKSRDEWAAELEATDACVAPVLSPREAVVHRQHVERGGFVDVAGVPQPAPAPRFSRTPTRRPGAPPPHGGTGVQALAGWDVPGALLSAAVAAGALLRPSLAPCRHESARGLAQ